MCKTLAEGGQRCPTHASGSQAISYEAEREYGLDEGVFRKVIGIFRKEAYHNGISDKINASKEAIKAFITERIEAIRNAVKMTDSEKRTAIRRWTRAAKEKVSMATLYSWKKASAIMVAGSMAVVLAACTNSGEKTENLPNDPDTPVAVQTEEGSTENIENVDANNENVGAFGYDYTTVEIPDDIKERYGEESAKNLVNDTFVPMEVIKSNTGLYKAGEKTENTYLPLKPYMTPQSWKVNTEALASEDDVPHVFIGYASTCNSEGKSPIVKEGATADTNDSSYEYMTCDEIQDTGNFKIDNISVKTESRAENSDLTDVPEHVVVSSSTAQTITGTDDGGNRVSQEYLYDLQVYMIPDPQKENHWLVDGLNWQSNYGETARN